MYSENIERVGIDRIDNNIGYESDNVLSCCSNCNMMKGTMSSSEFVKRVKAINSNIEEFESFKEHTPERNLFIFKRGHFLSGSHVKRLLILGMLSEKEIKYKIEDTLLDNESEMVGFVKLLIEGISLYAGKKKAKSKVMKTSVEKIKIIYKDFINNGRIDESLMCKLILNREWIK